MKNAISIGHDGYQRITIDFADEKSLRDAVKARGKIGYVRTPALDELSAKLGVPLVGYVDKDGLGVNNWTACRLTGASSIGSDMVLCKTDAKGALLPFGKTELYRVYAYLAEGLLIPDVGRGCDFFDEHEICPILPAFEIEPRYLYAERYPEMVLLTYAIGDEDIVEVGLEMAEYTCDLAERYRKDEGVYVPADEGFALQFGTSADAGTVFVCVQVTETGYDRSKVIPLATVIEAYEAGDVFVAK